MRQSNFSFKNVFLLAFWALLLVFSLGFQQTTLLQDARFLTTENTQQPTPRSESDNTTNDVAQAPLFCSSIRSTHINSRIFYQKENTLNTASAAPFLAVKTTYSFLFSGALLRPGNYLFLFRYTLF